MKVAVIGLGTMGAPMAANLLKGGARVVVHNRNRGAGGSRCALRGDARAATPRRAASGADFVLTCVSDTPTPRRSCSIEGGVIAGVARGAP
jgi:3-hydroxyisobutyrate dehydrogenase